MCLEVPVSELPRWGLVFIACPLNLSEEQRLRLLRVAAWAWFESQDEVRFDWGECKGVLRPSGEAVTLGTFYGQRFTAEVDLPDRSGQVEFLVTEHQLSLQRGFFSPEVAEA